MLSINTNLAGLIAQNSMKTSTDKLNQAIERMTTGLKINHASDNAANYSISTNLTTQLSAYDTAADNVAMGMDLVSYASDIISQMQDKAARLNALSTQARNGTYGAQSLSALNSEANAIMSELMRLYSTAEYNDISLFNRTAYTIAPHLPQAGASGFIDETALISMAAAGEGAGVAEGEVVGTTTEAPKAKAEYNGFIEDPTAGKDQAHIESLTSVTEANGTLTGTEYKVATVEDLVKLAELTNAGVNTRGKTFYLTADLDLGAYCDANMATGGWNPIGASSKPFKGTFDGNGHVIKNLKIDRETSDYQGLFGYTDSGSEIKNVGLEGVNIKGKNYVGGLVGYTASSSISNSYTAGDVRGAEEIGGFIGSFGGGIIINSYTTANVVGNNKVGSLIGLAHHGASLSNCYATGNVTGINYIGGLVGQVTHGVSIITNSYATGAVRGTSYVGGLVGCADSSISNSYATGDVNGTGNYVGGLVGQASSISNSYATGNVNGYLRVGGLIGHGNSAITNSYATGNVTGTSDEVGGLAGSFGSSTIANSYATGNVYGDSSVGGLVGLASSSSINNAYAIGAVNGLNYSTGGLVGDTIFGASISNSYATGPVSGNLYVGGLVGGAGPLAITSSYATGNVSGTSGVGGLAGRSLSSTITDCYATGEVTGNSFVGGFIGEFFGDSGIYEIRNTASYSTVNGTDSTSTGSLIGGAIMTSDGTSFGTLNITNSQSIAQNGINSIGGAYQQNVINYVRLASYDLSSMLAGISDVEFRNISTNLQVGIYSNNSSQLSFDTNFSFDLNLDSGIESVEAFNAIVTFENLLSEKATQLGAVQNRLDSALESIEVNINNLTSSRSTIRDADIAEVSSHYIQQQILQQASATLMATANQAPSIALQLI